MAKVSGPSVLEQHVEKGVLALCALFLIYAVFHWGLSSPDEEEAQKIFGKKFAPDKTDQFLLEQATDQQKRIKSATAPTESIPPYVDTLKGILSNPLPTGLLQVADLSSPHVPATMPEQEQMPTTSLADIAAAIPAPAKPAVNAQRVLSEGNARDVEMAFGASMYPWEELTSRWRDMIKTFDPRAIVVQQIVEVEELQADGTWGNPRELSLQPLPRKDATGKVIVPPVLPGFDGKNADAVRKAMDDLIKLDWPAQVLEPAYPSIWQQQQWLDWKAFLPETEWTNAVIDVGTTPGVTPMPTPGATPMPTAAPTPVPGVPYTAPTPPPYTRPTPPPSTTGPYRLPPPAPAGSGAAAGVSGLVADASRSFAPQQTPTPTAIPVPTRIPLLTPTPKPTPTPVAPPPPPVVAKVPTFPTVQAQMIKGKVLAWFCAGGIETGKTYRYRVKLKLVNPLLSYPEAVKDPADAKVQYVETPWSDWSNPVSVQRSSEFYLTGNSINQVSVTIFTKVAGQLVKQTMSVAPGQAIGREGTVSIPNPAGGANQVVKVDFATGAVVVDINFNRQFQRGPITKTTVEMTYLDAQGKLHTRLMDLDLSNLEYKRQNDEAKKAD